MRFLEVWSNPHSLTGFVLVREALNYDNSRIFTSERNGHVPSSSDEMVARVQLLFMASKSRLGFISRNTLVVVSEGSKSRNWGANV